MLMSGDCIVASQHVHSTPSDGGESSDDEAPSTGFLPLSLAVILFVTGMFVLGVIPTSSCTPDAAAVSEHE
jgi:hypothetical protein